MKNNYSPKFGVHTSIAGGLPKAVERAVEKACDCFQIFAHNPRGWQERPLLKEEIHEFKNAREKAGLSVLAIHAVYLINLAAQDEVNLRRSREAFRQEVLRGIAIGADYLVVHPGSSKTASTDAGIQTAINSIREATRKVKMNGLTILIENTAGQGSSIGCTFEQVADLVAGMVDEIPVGVCLDTAHTFAAGYDIACAKGFQQTVTQIKNTFGFDRLKLLHCNDSKAPLGSRVDRHQHIGLGHIGLEAFRRITHHPKFRQLPFILETPVDQVRGDEENLAVMRELSQSDFEKPVDST
ncbi:MAG: deoxyribonuclease IV [Acidobacteriota bacterium]